MMYHMVSDILTNFESLGIIGSIFAPYTSLIGNIFYAFIAGVFFLGFVQRLGVTPTAIISLAIWGVLSTVVPEQFANIAIIIVLITGAGLLTWLYFGRRRNSYG